MTNKRADNDNSDNSNGKDNDRSRSLRDDKQKGQTKGTNKDGERESFGLVDVEADALG
jgi:hypothetical protein